MCDYAFKMLIVGDVGVGKSSLFWRYMEDIFTPEYYSTVGTEFKYRQVEVAGKQVLLQIWDAAGEDRFRAMLEPYYRNSHAVFIVYDSTSVESFRNVDYWLKKVRHFCWKGVNLMLIGTKCDEVDKREVTKEEASHYAKQHGLSFMEASAKSGMNVKDVFRTLALEVYNRLVLKIVPSPSTRSEKEDTDEEDALQDRQEVEKGQSDGEDHVPSPSTPSKEEDNGDLLLGGQERAEEGQGDGNVAA